MSNFIQLKPSAQNPYQNENFVNTSKKVLKNRNWTFPVIPHFTWKTRVCPKYFVRDCIWKKSFAFNFLFKLDLLEKFGNSKTFNIRLATLQKSFRIYLTW